MTKLMARITVLVLLFIVGGGAFLLFGREGASATTSYCGSGQTATIEANISGAPNAVIYGTDGADVIVVNISNQPFGGKVQVYAKGGDDWVCAGGGTALIHGGAGNDQLWSEYGTLWGDGGRDELIGGPGDDTLYGGGGGDSLYGMGGNDQLYGGTGADKMDGGDNSPTPPRSDTCEVIQAGDQPFDCETIVS